MLLGSLAALLLASCATNDLQESNRRYSADLFKPASSASNPAQSTAPTVVSRSSDVIIRDGKPFCAIHNSPILYSQGYRNGAAADAALADRDFARIAKKHPNHLPAEWSLVRSGVYRFPGPVEYCLVCTQKLSDELRERAIAPGGSSSPQPAQRGHHLSMPRYLPGIGGSQRY